MSEISFNVLFSVFALTGFLLAAIPLPWHIKARNTGSSMLMLWTSLGCLIFCINSIVWNDNVANSAPVWCDISANYTIGASVGIPASSFCVVRRLYYMTKLQTISVEKAQRRREVAIDLLIGIGIPCIVMALEYVVELHPFAIYEQIGCYPFIYDTPLSYFLIYMWPLVFGSIGFIYAVITFRRAFRQKEQLKRMHHAGFSIGSGHYWRLMALCTVEIIFTVPLSLYVIITNATGAESVFPYVSWAFVHSDFSQIPQYPAVVWKSLPGTFGLETTRWSYVLCAFVVFSFFGWTREVREVYGQALLFICRHLGYSKPSLAPYLPTTVPKDKRRFTYACERTFVRDADLQVQSKHISMPVQARTKPNSFRTSLSFTSAASLETLTTSIFLAEPAPALTRDR